MTEDRLAFDEPRLVGDSMRQARIVARQISVLPERA
jgi:hypothetical protein